MRRASSPAGGFTLLEVLAAVAILAMVYVVLAGAAIQGLRAEGESERRLRASLVADEVLTELEAGLAAGAAPPLGSDQSQRGEFEVRVEVENFELPAGLLGAEPPPPGEERGGTAVLTSLLASTRPEMPGPLRSFRVEVAWSEVEEEHRVTRTTYAFDLEAARPLLEQIPVAGGEGAPRRAASGGPPGEEAR
jgi:prepilin-type N-terminal cleavage/methylation domain-containing protein